MRKVKGHGTGDCEGAMFSALGGIQKRAKTDTIPYVMPQTIATILLR